MLDLHYSKSPKMAETLIEINNNYSNISKVNE